MKNDLLQIIHKECDSYYRKLAFQLYEEHGIRNAERPMILINRFEKLQVSG